MAGDGPPHASPGQPRRRLRAVPVPATQSAGSDFVDEFAASLARRSKAIKHRAKLEIGRAEDEDDGARKVSRVDVDVTRTGALVRLVVWSDRWVWLHARRGTRRGLLWVTTLQGRLTSRDAPGLVARLERTIDACSPDAESAASITQFWREALAQGPREL